MRKVPPGSEIAGREGPWVVGMGAAGWGFEVVSCCAAGVQQEGFVILPVWVGRS